MSDLLYNWIFSSKQDRSPLWYTIAVSIAIWLVIWWFLSKQYWMSFFIIMLIWYIFYIENNSNDTVNVNITSQWIKVDTNFYAFSNISSFTLIYENENPILLRLNISNKMSIWSVDVWINNNIALDIKNILSQFLEENNKEQLTFIEKIIKILKL